MGNAREAALLALDRCHRQGGWSDGALRREAARAELDTRDAALASRLCYGVLQRQYLLDHYLTHLCSMKLEKLEPKVLELLRLGAYQLLFMDKIPPMAAVNETVELTKRHAKNPRAAGLVNAVLRNLDRRRDELPAPAGDWAARCAVTYSHPLWLVELFRETLGEAEAEALLAADNAEVPMAVQVNTTRCTAEALSARLAGEGVAVRAHPWLPDCLILEETGDLTRSGAFRDGLFYVQDPAARLAVLAAAPKPGERVLDLCAAPGGKSFAVAIAMEGRGTVVSRDVYPQKVEGIRAAARRLGLALTAECRDALEPVEEGAYDLVIADVPCSGLGIIRKKPEIRYKDPGAFGDLLPIQAEILENGARAVRPGGRLLYATCTLRREENEAQIAAFLDKEKNFTRIPFTLPEPFGRVAAGELTLWPHRDGTDGFFFALLERGR